MKNVYVTGYGGRIANQLVKMGCSRLTSDVTDSVAFDTEISLKHPEMIIHLACKSDVDYCEQPENKKEVDATNYAGSGIVFSMAEKHNIPVIFLSTDHVFSGDWLGNYSEKSDDIKPKNYYSLLKFATEGMAHAYDNVKIVRTSYLFTSYRGQVKSYLDSLQNKEDIYPPAFIWRSFMHLDHFCLALLEYVEKFDDMPKVLHISGSKTVSWWKFIRDYANCLGLDTSKVHQRFTDRGYTSHADRPKRAGLCTNLSKKLGIPQYSYQDGFEYD